MNDIDYEARKFLESAAKVLLSKKVYKDGWDAKKIIAHIVYYHEYYARVVQAIADNQVLPLIDESLAKVNAESAANYSKFSRKELLNRFESAHKLLMAKITKLDSSTKIPYKKGGSIYNPESYLEVISHHLAKHTKDLNRKL